MDREKIYIENEILKNTTPPTVAVLGKCLMNTKLDVVLSFCKTGDIVSFEGMLNRYHYRSMQFNNGFTGLVVDIYKGVKNE